MWFSMKNLFNRGLLLKERGEVRKALDDFSIAIRLRLERGNVYRHLGKSALVLRDFREACKRGNKGGCTSNL
jgi:hypothetical protein